MYFFFKIGGSRPALLRIGTITLSNISVEFIIFIYRVLTVNYTKHISNVKRISQYTYRHDIFDKELLPVLLPGARHQVVVHLDDAPRGHLFRGQGAGGEGGRGVGAVQVRY